MADLRLNINGQNNAGPALNDAAKGVQGLSGEVAKGVAVFEGFNIAISKGVEFLKDSVKAYEEQAKADRQLARVAGESTEAFKRQASALQESLGVSDDLVQTMQKMLLTYGEAPAEVDKTVRAILDLSAATGQDAVSAVSALTSSVTTGRTAFKDLGIEYDKTGTRSGVLASATEALAKKFAGAAQGEADSLSGSIAKAKQQFGEMQESFGGLVAKIAEKTGVIDSATWAFKQLANIINPDAKTKQFELATQIQEQTKSLKAYEDQIAAGQTISFQGQRAMETLRLSIASAQAEYDKLLVSMKGGDAPLATKGAADTVAAGPAKEKKTHTYDLLKDQAEAQSYSLDLQRKFEAAGAAIERDAIAESDAQYKKALADREAAQKNADARMLEDRKAAFKKAEEATKLEAEKQKQEAETWRQAGLQIGQAFANGLASAIEQLASGGEVDIAGIAIDLLTTAMATIINVYEPGLGSIVGTVANAGLHAAYSASKPRKKRHTGGWAGDEMPHYHTGAWVGSDEEAAILQRGERVLSRAEVGNMGGPRGVEQAARGTGGGITVNVQAFDSSSMATFFSREGGRGLLRAVRSGQGAPTLLFGGGR